MENDAASLNPCHISIESKHCLSVLNFLYQQTTLAVVDQSCVAGRLGAGRGYLLVLFPSSSAVSRNM